MWSGRSRVKYDAQAVDLNTGIMGTAPGGGEEPRRRQWAGAYQEVCLGHVKFELPIDIQVDITR